MGRLNARRHQAAGRDTGFTLVEVAVALVILSIILSALGAFLLSAVKVQRSNEYRNKATQAGTQIVESYRALAWDLLGFYQDDTAATTSCTGGDAVRIPVPAAPATKSAQVPVGGTQTVTIGNVRYDTTACIYWDDDPTDGLGSADADGVPQDIKRIVVDVRWANAGGPKHLEVTGRRAPTAQEVMPKSGSATVPFGILNAAATPTSAAIDPSGLTVVPVDFLVDTTAGVSLLQLRWTDAAGTSHFENFSTAASTTNWNYTLPAGSGPFPASTTSFSIVAVSATGEQNSQAVSVSFSTAASTLTIPSLTTTSNSVDVNSAGYTTSDFTLSAVASESVTGMTVTYTNRSGGQVIRTMATTGPNGTITFPAGSGPFPDTADVFTVTASSASGAASRSITVTFVPPTVIPVEVTSISVSPQLCLSAPPGNQKVLRSSTVTVDVEGVGTADTLMLEFNDTTKHKVKAPNSTAVSITGGARFHFPIPTAWEWNATSLTVTALATRESDMTQSPVTSPDSSTIKYAQNVNEC